MSARRILSTLTMQLVTEATNKVLPIVVLHLVVQRLGAEGFGVARFGFGLVDTMFPLIVFGYLSLASVDLGRSKDDADRRQVIWEVVTLKLIHSLILALVLAALVLLVPRYEPYQPVVFSLFFLLFTTAIDMGFVHVGTARLFSLNVAVTVIKIVGFLGILFFVQDPGDVISFAILYFGLNGLISLFSFFLNTKKYGFVLVTRAQLADRFQRSLPYVAIVVFGYALSRFDLFIVEAYFGSKGAGLYGGVAQISLALANAASAINLVFFSEVVGSKTKQELTRLIDFGAFGVFAILIPIAVGSWFVDDQLVGWILSAEFIPLAPTMSILIAGLLGQGLIFVFGSQVLMFHKQAKHLNAVMIAAFGIGLLAALALVGSYGYAGIGMGTTIGRLFAGILAVWFARSFLDHLPWQDLLKITGCALFMALAIYFSPWRGLLESLTIGIASYGLAMVVINRSRALKLVSKIIKR